MHRPQDALAFGAKILKDQLSIFINFQEEVERGIVETSSSGQLNEVLYRPVEELELSVRSANCLQNADIELSRSGIRLDQLVVESLVVLSRW